MDENSKMDVEEIEKRLARFRPRSPSPECRTRIGKALAEAGTEPGKRYRFVPVVLAGMGGMAAAVLLVAGLLIPVRHRSGGNEVVQAGAGQPVVVQQPCLETRPGEETRPAIARFAVEPETGNASAPVRIQSRYVLGISPWAGNPVVLHGRLMEPVRIHWLDRRERLWEDRGVRETEIATGAGLSYVVRPLL